MWLGTLSSEAELMALWLSAGFLNWPLATPETGGPGGFQGMGPACSGAEPHPAPMATSLRQFRHACFTVPTMSLVYLTQNMWTTELAGRLLE